VIFLSLVYMLALAVAAVLLAILYIQPRVLQATAGHRAGRAFLVLVAVVGALVHPVLGLLVFAAYVVSAPRDEGFSTPPGTSTGVPRFRSMHCEQMGDGQRVLLGPGGTVVRSHEVTQRFPHVRFAGEPCNPCDSDCEFDLLALEEGLRAGVVPSPPLTIPGPQPAQPPFPKPLPKTEN
jgi:hypothetical protein